MNCGLDELALHHLDFDHVLTTCSVNPVSVVYFQTFYTNIFGYQTVEGVIIVSD